VVFTIAGASGSTFNLGVNTTAYGAYTSGGLASKYAQPADALTWSGEFDLPVRFDTVNCAPASRPWIRRARRRCIICSRCRWWSCGCDHELFAELQAFFDPFQPALV